MAERLVRADRRLFIAVRFRGWRERRCHWPRIDHSIDRPSIYLSTNLVTSPHACRLYHYMGRIYEYMRRLYHYKGRLHHYMRRLYHYIGRLYQNMSRL